MLVGLLVRPLVVPHNEIVRPLVGPHDEILRNLLTWKTGYVAIASRRGEGRGNQLISKTGSVEIASRLVTVTRSCCYSRGFLQLQGVLKENTLLQEFCYRRGRYSEVSLY
jgi:hypothetical protein